MKKKVFCFLSAIIIAACSEKQANSKESSLTAAEPAAQTFTPGSINEMMIFQRAVEAVIWGMPAVNYDLMLKAMLENTNAKQNEIIYWSKPVDWKNQTLTPNPDAIYFMLFFNTKDIGPLVVDVPAAKGGSFAANIDNVWQMPLEDAGPYGADKGAGGKYLILPPGYQQKVPNGYIVLKADSYEGYGLFRSNLASHSQSDIANAVAYGKQLKVYPLSKAQKPDTTKYTDAKEVLYNSVIPYNLDFYTSLNRIVQTQPMLSRDKLMLDQLRSIGIEKGKPFIPDAKMKAILNAAAKKANEYLEYMYDKGFPPINPQYNWAVPAMPDLVKAGSSGYAESDIYPVDARALTYSIGYIGIKRLGTAQIYLISGKDREGKALDGSKNYRLHVPSNVPTKQYWSATVYDRATHALIKNLSRASRASNAAELQKNPDGSVDIFFGPKPPQGKDSNWIPTDPKGRFEVLFRLYGPEKPFFEKKWKLADLEEF